jgi:hypothetical protein
MARRQCQLILAKKTDNYLVIVCLSVSVLCFVQLFMGTFMRLQLGLNPVGKFQSQRVRSRPFN